MLYAYMRETHERPIAICTPRSQLCALFFALLSLGVQSARAQDPLIATENRSASIVARESKAPERFVVGCDSGDITIEIDATLTDSRVEAVFQLVGRSASDLANRKATIRLFATLVESIERRLPRPSLYRLLSISRPKRTEPVIPE